MKTLGLFKKHFLLLLFLFMYAFLKAQVGIGTIDPNPGAALEIKSTDKGLLIPKMTKSERDNIDVSTTPDGLLIYQTDETPGFYYYQNGAWRGFSTDRPVLIEKMVIPRCHKYAGDSGNALTGTFSTTVDGTPTTVTWRMRWDRRQTNTGSVNISGNDVVSAPAKSEKIEVKYEFSPPLPFTPRSVMYTSYKDTSANNYPDTFVISTVKATNSLLRVNISRTDIYGEPGNNDCWWAEDLKFDALIIE